jgi:hypothetical protein
MTTGSATEARRFRSPSGIVALWTGVLAGPLAWMLGLNLQYALVLVACSGGSMLLLHLVSVVTLAMAAGGAWIAWREWGRAGREVPGEGGGTIPRSRFMAAVGLLGSLFFSGVILAQWVGSFFLHPCMGI